MALVGGFAIPGGCLSCILGYAGAVFIEAAQTVLGVGVTLIGCPAVPGRRLGRILGHAGAIFIAYAQVILSDGLALFCRLAVPACCLGQILGYARTGFIAIATGATRLWSNIPEDKEEERDAILKRREQYIENYKIAIQLNETIDRLHRSIAGIQQEIDKKREAEKAFAAEVKEMAKTPEGEARFARSYAAIGNVGILDGEDREFGIRLRENRINSQSIAMLKNQFASDRTQLSAARQQLEPVLLRLKKNPDLSGLEPAGRVAGILREMEDEQAHVISVAKIINTKMNDSISRMEAIMNSSDAQELQADDQSYLTAILRGNKISPQDKAVIEAERQRLQREELQRQRDEAAEKERLAQQAKLNEVLANTAESVQENTAEDENAQLNFDVL